MKTIDLVGLMPLATAYEDIVSMREVYSQQIRSISQDPSAVRVNKIELYYEDIKKLRLNVEQGGACSFYKIVKALNTESIEKTSVFGDFAPRDNALINNYRQSEFNNIAVYSLRNTEEGKAMVSHIASKALNLDYDRLFMITSEEFNVYVRAGDIKSFYDMIGTGHLMVISGDVIKVTEAHLVISKKFDHIYGRR